MPTPPIPGPAPDPAPDPVADPRLAARSWESLFRAQVALMRRFAADDIWHDVTMREYDVLFTLSRAPGGELRLRDLNEGILLAQSSLSRMVERLEARGLVSRAVPADDQRGTLVRLTVAGARVQRATGRAHVRSIDHYVTGALDADELVELGRLTDKLRAAQESIEVHDPAGDLAREPVRDTASDPVHPTGHDGR